MKILGIIAEYNPFHLGHKYHLELSKLNTKANYTVAIMSGSFVQRGEPAIVDKFSRAKMAILSGVDLVIELPFIYSGQTAEIFAKGAIQILDSLNSINYISFGSEYDDLENLKTISKTLIDEPEEFQIYLKESLSSGLSFPKSRVIALEKYFKNNNETLYKYINPILSGSNNILAIEYLKELYFLNSNIEPIIINRKGNNYNDNELNNKFSSATSIRNSLLNNEYDNVKKYLPKQSYEIINNFKEEFNNFNRIENYYSLLNYNFIINNLSIRDIFDIGEDLGNRFINNFEKVDDISDLIKLITNKNYTSTRVKRSIINIIMHNYQKEYLDLLNEKPKYIRVLGSNDKGFEILNKIKKNSDTIILTKFNQHKKFPELDKFINLEKKSTDLYYLGLLNKPKINYDYIKNPFIYTKK